MLQTTHNFNKLNYNHVTL